MVEINKRVSEKIMKRNNSKELKHTSWIEINGEVRTGILFGQREKTLPEKRN